MRRLRVWLAALAAVVATPCMAAPLAVYGGLPNIEQASVSPDGELLGLIWTDGENRRIVVTRVADGKLAFMTAAGDAKIRSLQWAGDQHLIITSSVTANAMGVVAPRDEWVMAFDLNLETRKLRPLMRDVKNAMNVIVDQPEVRIVKGKPFVFIEGIHFASSTGRRGLYRVDLATGSHQQLSPGEQSTRDWLVSAEGEPLAQLVYDDRRGRWSVRTLSGLWRTIVEGEDHNPPDLLGLGRDGRSILLGVDGEDDAVWQEVASDGAPGERLPVTDEQSAILAPDDGRLIGQFALVGDERRYVFFEPQDRQAWAAVEKAFPGDQVSLVSWSSDRRKILVLVDSPALGPAYSMIDLGAKTATWIGARYEKLREGDIAPQRPIRFRAQDGLQLSGYLTTPVGRPAKGLPLVVFPHGGPAARDAPGFDWWTQAMASRGYAVLRVNFRGSDGFGAEFLDAGFGEWGRKMQTDLSDGVRHLAKEGVIDPKRVCIVGASYGGYAALAGATIDRGVYRCAASIAGPADLRRQVDFSRDRGGVRTLRYWTRYMGAKDLRDPVLAEISPAVQAAKADIPILLVHGRDDTVVPLEQSRIMAEALEKAGKPFELVIQKGEDHWLTRGETRLAMLEAVVAFLEKHNPPDAPVAGKPAQP